MIMETGSHRIMVRRLNGRFLQLIKEIKWQKNRRGSKQGNSSHDLILQGTK